MQQEKQNCLVAMAKLSRKTENHTVPLHPNILTISERTISKLVGFRLSSK